MRNRTWMLCLLALAACSADDGTSRPGNTSQPPATPSGGNAANGGSAGAPSGQLDNPTLPTAGASANPPPVDKPSGNPNLCEVVHLNANPSTPDMLIVLDRSGSMQVGGRWVPSSNAVHTIVNRLQSQIRFGLALFPDPSAVGSSTGGGVQIDASVCLTDPDPIACLGNLLADAGVGINTGNTGGACAPGKIVVETDLNNGAAIDAALAMTSPNGGTPTPETLQRLIDGFATPTGPDVMVRPKFILLVTDGQPTCPNGAGSITTQPDIDASNSAIETLASRGVRTYVIGYNTSGPGNEMVSAVLDGFAQRGGTGDKQHRPVENEQNLFDEFQRIAGDAVSCTFVLDQTPPRPDYVLVRVDGAQVNLNDPNGWSLVNGRTVELRGTTCERLKSDGSHLVDAEVRCEVVTPE